MEIEYYHFDDGSNAIDPFLDSLVNDGIFELRTVQGNNIERILYFFFEGNKAVLTNGFTKRVKRHQEGNLT